MKCLIYKTFLLSFILFSMSTPIFSSETTLSELEVDCALYEYTKDDYKWILRWNVANANFVLIPGISENAFQPEDSILVGNGIYTVIAFNFNKVLASFVYCTIDPHLPPGYEPLTAIIPFYLIKTGECVYWKRFRSSTPFNKVGWHVIDVLQSLGYTVSQSEYFNCIKITTLGFLPHGLLCNGKECDLPIDKRVIERKTAFEITLYTYSEYMEIISEYAFEHKPNEICISIRPILLSRHRREGGEWNYNINDIPLAYPLCQQILISIERKCN